MAEPDAILPQIEWWNLLTRTAEIGWTRIAGREAIEAAAGRRVRALIEFAAARSPFYRRMWRGVAPTRVALRELPVVTRRDLMAHFDAWLTDRSVRCEDVTRFLRDRSHIGEPLAGKHLEWMNNGGTGEPGVYLHESLSRLVAEINAFRPAFLASYPSTLVMLADERLADTAPLPDPYSGKLGEVVVTQSAMASSTGEFHA